MPGPPWPPETGTWATYALHCHCGAIRYSMKISPPLLASQNPSPSSDPVYVAKNCQCSHCVRKGVIAIHPKAMNVEFTQGMEHRVDYYTGAKKNPHWFCGKCGSTLGGDLTKATTASLPREEQRYYVNLRMLAHVSPDELTTEVSTFMRDAPPHYSVD